MSIALAAPERADRVLARLDVVGLILGDKAGETRLAAAAWRHYALSSAVRHVIFWGRAAAHHGDQLAELRSARGIGLEAVGLRAFTRFEPIDLMEDCETALALFAPLGGPAVAVFDPADPLESGLIGVLRDVGALGPETA